MAPEPKSRTLALGLLAAMGLSALVALFVLARGRGGAPTGPAAGAAAARRAARAWPDSDAPRVQDPAMLRSDADRSGLEMVQRPPEASPGAQTDAAGGRATDGSRDGGSAAGTGTAAPRRAPGAAGALTEAEKAELGRLAGRDMLDASQAAEVAGDHGLWTRALKALAGHPRLLSFVINNDMVVDAFMSRPAFQHKCRSAQAYTGWFADPKRAGGVNQALDLFTAVMHSHNEMPTVMFGSKLASAVLECPSSRSIVKDPAAITQIVTANPRMLQVLMDPALMKGLAASPAAMTSFQSVQDNLSP